MHFPPWRRLKKENTVSPPPKALLHFVVWAMKYCLSLVVNRTRLQTSATHGFLNHTHRWLHHRRIENKKHARTHTDTDIQFRASVASSPLVPQTDRVIKSSLQCMQWQESCTLADATFAACFCSSVATGKPARHVEWFLTRAEGMCVCGLKMRGSASAVKQIWHSDNQVLNCYSGFQNLKWGTCVYYVYLWVAFFSSSDTKCSLTFHCDIAF